VIDTSAIGVLAEVCRDSDQVVIGSLGKLVEMQRVQTCLAREFPSLIHHCQPFVPW
jgi:hypothetical protein